MSKNKEQEEFVGSFDDEDSDNNTPRPYSGLDYQWMSLDPSWGKEATAGLTEHLKRVDGEIRKTKDGKILIKTSSLWELLSYYTRDMRLGNLSPVNGEFEYAQYWIDSAGVYLRRNMPKSFLAAITKAITIIELSQAKGGFLRKNNKTQTKRWEEVPAEKKRRLLGGQEGG